jgi:hypothetical protein
MTFYLGGKMNRKGKIGISLVLIGFAIPIVLFFFQEDGAIYESQTTNAFERTLTPEEVLLVQKKLDELEKKMDRIEDRIQRLTLIQAIYGVFEMSNSESPIWKIRNVKTVSIPFRQIVGIGIALIFLGFGMFIFSFFRKDRSKSPGAEE